MATTTNRQVPLVLLGVVDRIAAEPLAKILRQEGMVVAVAQGERGCLRVATAIQPDITLSIRGYHVHWWLFCERTHCRDTHISLAARH